jgi:hypothetical protein
MGPRSEGEYQENDGVPYHHHRYKISNRNIQIPNNIQIRKSNDLNILVIYLLFDCRFVCLNFGH